MKIVADAKLLAVGDYFQHLGELQLIPGREISAQDLVDADVLLVRSITTVNEDLLRATPVQFVATATSGSDHIDIDYLRNRGIVFADAKGSNAGAVVDYCFTVLASAVLQKKLDLATATIGIVGGGNVGGLFAQKLRALNISYRLCDPLLAESSGNKSPSQFNQSYCSLDEVLACDVLSLHVPLTRHGEYPTHCLIGQRCLNKLPLNAVLINTCRGSVVDESALSEFLLQRDDVLCFFDVWENEPRVSRLVADKTQIATPHIAGYSVEAKHAATRFIAVALEKHFSLAAEAGAFPLPDEPPVLQGLSSSSNERAHWELLLQVFPLEKLSERFKQSLAESDPDLSFDAFRQELLGRREFRSYSVKADHYSQTQKHFLSILGFNLT